MSIKTILTCLTDVDTANSVLAAAVVLARRHGGHVVGLHTLESLMVYPGIAVHAPDIIFTEFARSQGKQSAAIQKIFEHHLHAEDFVSEWRLLKSCSATAAERIVESAQSADLVLMPAADPEAESQAHHHLLETVIRLSGRPVVVVPRGFAGDRLGQKILIGWNGTREAVRAVHDARTLLCAGDSVHILCVNEHSGDAGLEATSNDLATSFARHQIDTTLVERSWHQPGVAAALNKEAFEQGADMIAVGAFGHSRAYDLVIGAASRELLRKADLPVLFSR